MMVRETRIIRCLARVLPFGSYEGDARYAVATLSTASDGSPKPSWVGSLLENGKGCFCVTVNLIFFRNLVRVESCALARAP